MRFTSALSLAVLMGLFFASTVRAEYSMYVPQITDFVSFMRAVYFMAGNIQYYATFLPWSGFCLMFVVGWYSTYYSDKPEFQSMDKIFWRCHKGVREEIVKNWMY